MTDRGFYLVSRGLFDHPRFKPRKPFSDLMAWLWLNEYAAHTPRDVSIDCGSTIKTVHLERGQLTYSIRFLAMAWRWSDKRVQRFLATTADDRLVTTATTTGQTIITLCNYDKEQRRVSETTTATTTATTTVATTNKKQLNQLEKEIAPQAFETGFREWYAVYPKKKKSDAAKRAYLKVVRSGRIDHDRLMQRTKAFAAEWAGKQKEERQFIPYPASWLNDGGFDDEQEDGAPVVRDPRTFGDEDWRRRLKFSQENSTWDDAAWGPEPGEPGCLVPSHLILAPVSSSKGAA